METDVVTYKGVNLLFLRPDIDNDDLLIYLLTYYRVLSPDTIYKNVKYMTKHDIERRYVARVGKAISIDNKTYVKPKKTSNEVPFDYQPMKENAAFGKQNAGRYLACILLAKSYSEEFLPCDPYEAKGFFADNFKGSVEEVFERFCKSKNQDKNELLSYYRNIAEKNRAKQYYKKQPEKKFSTIDLLTNAFLHITK